MLIRCSDNCQFQEDGFCGLKNIYSAEVTSSTDQVNDTGCVYFKPKIRKKDNQRDAQSIQVGRDALGTP